MSVEREEFEPLPGINAGKQRGVILGQHVDRYPVRHRPATAACCAIPAAVCFLAEMKVRNDRDYEKDYLNGTGPGTFVDAPAGMVFVLWPGDAHMPGMQVQGASPVRKIVLKVALAD